jgi:hypothetical protein
MKTAVKKEKKYQSDNNKVDKEKKQKVDSTLSRMYGCLKGMFEYESDDIFFQYKFQ